MAWRLASWPTSRSPSLLNATIDGVVRPPSGLGITLGSLPSMMATHELVVPRSIPIVFPMNLISFLTVSGPAAFTFNIDNAVTPSHTQRPCHLCRVAYGAVETILGKSEWKAGGLAGCPRLTG